MNLLDATRAHGDSSGFLRAEDRRTRYFAFALALTSVFVATALACHAMGLRGAPGRPGMFLVDGVFGIARAMGFLPATIATLLILGSSAVALLTNASFVSLGMRAIEAATSGFLISVLMGSLGHADGGSVGLLLGDRLSRMMSIPIATTLCGITTVLAVWLVIEGNMRECARAGRVPRGSLLRAISESVSSQSLAPQAFEKPVETQSPIQRESFFSTGAPVADPEVRLRGESPSSGPSEPAETAIAVLPDEPPADPEVRLRPRRPRWRETAPEESVETAPEASNTKPRHFETTAGAEVFVREPQSPESIVAEPNANEARIDEPNQTVEQAGAGQVDVQTDVAERLDPGTNEGATTAVADRRNGNVGGDGLPGFVGGDLVGELEPPASVDSNTGVEGIGEGGKLYEAGEEWKEEGIAVAEAGESHENEIGELIEEAVDGTDGQGVREPGVIVLTVPEVSYVEADSWDLPRTIPTDTAVTADTAIPTDAAIATEAAQPDTTVVPDVLVPEAAIVSEQPSTELRSGVLEAIAMANAALIDAVLADAAVPHAAETKAAVDSAAVVVDRAARFVLGEGRASISFLQRKLQVSFNDAQHVMAQLEAAGAVGPYRGNPSRDILLTLSQWEAQRSA